MLQLLRVKISGLFVESRGLSVDDIEQRRRAIAPPQDRSLDSAANTTGPPP
jgi:hypothetical protein